MPWVTSTLSRTTGPAMIDCSTVMKLFISAMLAAAVFAAEPKVIPIWPGAAPGSENWNWEESSTVGQDQLRRVGNVTRPVLMAYLPDAAAANGTAVVVCPGGGFRWLAIEHEGSQVAAYLNSLGVAAFVLKYRLARTGDAGENDPATMAERRKTVMPLSVADGLQAIRVVREHAAEWRLSKNRIGIIGFSAGGYVASAAALQYDAESRPDFAAPIYPATPENVTPPAGSPPLFLAHAADDMTVPVLRNTMRLFAAWQTAQIPVELHVYSKGGHGFGMKKAGLPVDTWIDRFRDWLAVQGLLRRP
jgi:acetyl esterase/lipase